MAPYLITPDRRPLFAPGEYLRGWLRGVALRAVAFVRRDAEFFGNLARCFALFESVGVRVPANNVVALHLSGEILP